MIEIRKIDREHLDGVAELEQLCFSEPWSKNSLCMLLDGNGVGFVALLEGQVAAYGGMLCVCGEGQITNIATHPQHRRRGMGRDIVGTLVEYARTAGLSEIFLEVRRSNEAAKQLYLSCGFEEVGERKSFYRCPVEDAIIMKYTVR